MTEADLAAAAAAAEADAGALGAELARPWARIWVARPPAETQVAGLLTGWHVADELHVLNLVTHPAWRRRGIGRSLLAHAIAYSQGQTISRVLLEVRRSNEVAIRLYRAAGFFAAGVRRRYYADDEDAIEMALGIDAVTRAVVRRPDSGKLEA